MRALGVVAEHALCPGLRPEMLVSLTAPKRGARFFQGPFHYLGGRFVPPAIKARPFFLPITPATKSVRAVASAPTCLACTLRCTWATVKRLLRLMPSCILKADKGCSRVCMSQEKYHLRLPPYPGTSQCVKISGSGSSGSGQQQRHAGTNGSGSGVDPSAIRLNYDLAEHSGGLREEDADADPFAQFKRWFEVRDALFGAAHCHACARSKGPSSSYKHMLVPRPAT